MPKAKPTVSDELMERLCWFPRCGEEGHLTFHPAEITWDVVPEPVRQHYRDRGAFPDRVVAYPGPKRQMYGRPLEPKIYLLVHGEDGFLEAWAELPHPSLRGEPAYWQRDSKINLRRGWPW